MDRKDEQAALIARRLRDRIGREPMPGSRDHARAAGFAQPSEDLLELHERHAVTDIDIRFRNPVLRRLLTPFRHLMLRPLFDLAARQSAVNGLTARVLSDVWNRQAELQAGGTAKSQEQAIRALRRRVRTLEAALEALQVESGRGPDD